MGFIRTGYVTLTLALVLSAHALGAGVEVYLEPERFVEQSFPVVPEAGVVWLNKERKEEAARILGRPYKGLRIRYWLQGGRTAWILEEIGKVELITAGFVVEDGRMVDMQVLIYRESHGWEVRYPFFTDQFKGLGRKEKGGLDRKIDGISGATLSVNALTRLSELAIYLHGEVNQ